MTSFRPELGFAALSPTYGSDAVARGLARRSLRDRLEQARADLLAPIVGAVAAGFVYPLVAED